MQASAAAAALRTLEPFKSGPLEGARLAPNVYVVRSYGDAIAAALPQGRLVILAVKTPTSGRHAGQVRAAWQDGAVRDVAPDVLAAAIRSAE